MSTATGRVDADLYDAVVDVGAGGDPDPRADYTADLHYGGADFEFDITDEWPFPDASLRGVVARHVFEHVTHDELSECVFPEVARVLQPDGWLDVRTPLGSDARTDPTHRSRWEWRTPDHHADNANHWQDDYGLELVDKGMTVWMIQPLEVFTPLIRFGGHTWPMEFWYEIPGATGELRSEYQRVDR